MIRWGRPVTQPAPDTRAERGRIAALERGVVYLLVAFPVGYSVGRIIKHVIHRGHA
jgi:hypothetical protein